MNLVKLIFYLILVNFKLSYLVFQDIVFLFFTITTVAYAIVVKCVVRCFLYFNVLKQVLAGFNKYL